MAEIDEAVDELYRTFRTYRLGPEFSGCPHCVSKAESQCLVSTPLHDLEVEDLIRYAQKAITTWGTSQDFKHFVPRLLDLVAADPEGFLFLEVLYSKLRLAEWQSWDAPEARTVDRFSTALWVHCLEQPADDSATHLVDTVLCALAQAFASVSPFLRTWERAESSSASRHLAYFLIINLGHSSEKQVPTNAFWEDSPSQAQEVREWLKSPASALVLSRSTDLNGSLNGIPLAESWNLLKTFVGSAA